MPVIDADGGPLWVEVEGPQHFRVMRYDCAGSPGAQHGAAGTLRSVPSRHNISPSMTRRQRR